MTMRELAKLANVSVSTVSKAFHDAEDISDKTRKLVFDTAMKHGCFGKFYKGKFHKQIIAIICPEVGSSFYTAYVEQIQRIVEDSNGITLISTDHFNSTAQAELLDYYASYLQVDGIIVFNLSTSIKKGYDIPIVSIFGNTDHTIDAVHVNLEAPILEAVELLHDLGHKKIAFIGEKLTTKKANIFSKVVSPEDSIKIESQYRFEEAGKDGIRQLLSTSDAYSAVICAYDNIALGAIKQLRRSGYRVPEDFSVIGINNISSSEHAETALTTIDTNPAEVCMLAWDIIQKKQQSKYYHSKQNITITAKLIIRESVGPKAK